MKRQDIKLNSAQRAAVDSIEGPLLVVAGPGTGKTQLLSARIANILEKTDTLPSNILCLTFTEKGASNMLDRLASFIGQAAYEVNIDTYHAFGDELIHDYPEYFSELRLESLIDELGQHEIFNQLIEQLSYQNPLKTTGPKDLISAISEAKRGLLNANDVHKIATENLEFITQTSPVISDIFADLKRMPGKLDKSLPYFTKTLKSLIDATPDKTTNQTYDSLAKTATNQLQQALDEAEQANSTKPLTAWKQVWLAKNTKNQFVLSGEMTNKKLLQLAKIFEDYQAILTQRGLYDYDDMILKTVASLEAKDDFRFSLQEKHQYILLDEYQDTNAAQAKLVYLLTNNPVSEGRPNVMAVGDDDQAIYAFQGAESSNLLNFATNYKNTKIITLTENYRSQPDIISSAKAIVSQISERISDQFSDVSKDLVFSGEKQQPTIIRQEFLSGVAENQWVAQTIENLITQQAIKPSEIAVLAPKHKILEALVPALNELDIPVHYEKRENILEAPVVQQLITMSRLVVALADNDVELSSSLWPEVLTYEFWRIDIEDVWQISWQPERNWTKKLLKSKHRWIALFFMQCAAASKIETLEQVIDYLIGSYSIKLQDAKLKSATSPLKAYYTSKELEQTEPDKFYQLISHLTVLRQKLRDRQASNDEALKLSDMVELVDLYDEANERMINTSPYNQASESVQLMTVYKAKGLEFERVFLVECQDEVWGSKARSGSNRVALPANLTPIRQLGSNDDDRLRLLFVALTRAKNGLYLTSALKNYADKSSTRLKYFNENEDEQGIIRTNILPQKYQNVLLNHEEITDTKTLEINWRLAHEKALNQTNLKALLNERLEAFQLSPTHLNTFIDLERGGPRQFLLNTLLRFPQAPTSSSQYGNAIHETLEWLQHTKNDKKNLSTKIILEQFEKIIASKKLARDEATRRVEQGRFELTKYLEKASFRQGDQSEVKFRNEAVFVGQAHLNGKIDKLEINCDKKQLVIVDYKTGKPSEKWASNLKLHKYKQQLYFYKLLIEKSSKWQGWQVGKERLDFIKPNEQGEAISLELNFNQQEFDQTKALIEAVWQKIKSLDLPDTSAYPNTFAGSIRFEQDLVDGVI